jgi:hypothetical protein
LILKTGEAVMPNDPSTRPLPWNWNPNSRSPVSPTVRETARAQFAAAAKAANEEHNTARAASQAKTQRLRELRMSRDAAAAQERTAEAAKAKRGKAAGKSKAPKK